MRLLKLVPDNTNIDFLRWRNIFMIGSILLMLASVALVATRGLNLGVDFVGGQMIRMQFNQSPNLDHIRTAVGSVVDGDVTIQQFGSPRDISIRTPLVGTDKESADRAAMKVQAAVQAKYPEARVTSVDTVSGKVSNELFRTGALSLLLAMIAISIYIWFRFEWQFGVGALFSLFHDITLTFGFFALTQLEFNLNIVAAMLTIIGYSLNDTIVVYDRIRENLKKYRKMDLIQLLNLTVNETLSRTVMTSFTMLITLLVLMLIGPDVIFGFTAAMLLGIFIGTYSSIYMAAPILVWLKVKADSFLPQEDDGKQVARRASDGAVV